MFLLGDAHESTKPPLEELRKKSMCEGERERERERVKEKEEGRRYGMLECIWYSLSCVCTRVRVNTLWLLQTNAPLHSRLLPLQLLSLR